jgi:6-phosphogluconolactonase (cycloisomerase 2 family)
MRSRGLLGAVGTTLVVAMASAAGEPVIRVQALSVGSFDSVAGAAMSPDFADLYVLVWLEHEIYTYRPDPVTTLLTQTRKTPVPLEDSATLTMSADSANVYVAGYQGVRSFERDGATGVLSEIQTISNGVDGVDGIGSDVEVTSDGRRVYTGGGLVHLDRDPGTGLLTFVEELGVPTSRLDVSADGQHLYAASKHPGDTTYSIDLYAVDSGTGQLTLLDSYGAAAGVNDATAVRVAPDGAYVYVGNGANDTIAALSRDAVTGLLTFVASYPGFRATDFRIAGDGSRLVAIDSELGTWSGALFSRDPGTGALTFVQTNAAERGMAFGPQPSVMYTVDPSSVYVERDLLVDCPPEPAAGCIGETGTGRGSLVIKNVGGSPAPRTKLLWRWRDGEATTVADFGDPIASTDHVLCIYDATPGDGLLLRRVVRTGPCGQGSCWTVLPDGRLRYKDKTQLPDGVKSVKATPGPDGAAEIQLKSRNGGLAKRWTQLFLLPVVAQLHNNDGTCWEATYSSADDRVTGTLRVVHTFRASSD